MEKTDRELLIKEISSRLSYEIKVQVFGWDEEKGEVAVPLKVYSINTDGYISLEYNHYDVESVYIEDCLLYLRPMSSMTEKESKEFALLQTDFYVDGFLYPIAAINMINWLNSHYFDYCGLIERGLALEALEGMYNN